MNVFLTRALLNQGQNVLNVLLLEREIPVAPSGDKESTDSCI